MQLTVAKRGVLTEIYKFYATKIKLSYFFCVIAKKLQIILYNQRRICYNIMEKGVLL